MNEQSVTQGTRNLTITMPPTITINPTDNVEVQCRVNGREVYIPLEEIFNIFAKKIVENIKYKGFRV